MKRSVSAAAVHAAENLYGCTHRKSTPVRTRTIFLAKLAALGTAPGVAVAALNIFTALIMSVMEKRRDIAVLLSLGAREAQIARIFIVQGLLIGACGIVLGLVSGYGLSFLADRFRWITLDAEIYSVSYVPFHPEFADALWISLTALAVSFVATLHPARSATRLMPVETLRYE